MPRPAADPYAVLGVEPSAPDAEVRAAYRRLARLHHPDHNAGSAESARRFALVQDAYSTILQRRRAAARTGVPRGGEATGPAAAGEQRAPRPAAGEADIEARLAALERELHAARQEAARAAAAAVREQPRRPTPEELGYVTTDDSFTRILDDAGAEIADRLSRAGRGPLGKRLSELLGLDEDRPAGD